MVTQAIIGNLSCCFIPLQWWQVTFEPSCFNLPLCDISPFTHQNTCSITRTKRSTYVRLTDLKDWIYIWLYDLYDYAQLGLTALGSRGRGWGNAEWQSRWSCWCAGLEADVEEAPSSVDLELELEDCAGSFWKKQGEHMRRLTRVIREW